jgi:hypothetical protein
MSTSVSIHHIQDLTFKQENLFMPDGSLIRLMYVTAVDKKYLNTYGNLYANAESQAHYSRG